MVAASGSDPPTRGLTDAGNRVAPLHLPRGTDTIPQMARAISTAPSDFPSLQKNVNGRRLVYLDGPAGTQVPQTVIEAVADYYRNSNANTHGFFQTSVETDEVIMGARAAVADFLGAPDPRCISFGANMTSLAFALSHALGRGIREQDEIVVTQLDHEAIVHHGCGSASMAPSFGKFLCWRTERST